MDGEDAPAAPAEAHLGASTAPFNAIVMADVDMLHENLWAQRVQSLFGGASYRSANGNAPFLVGALENLSGSDDLISLRSREAYRRPFLRKEELAREAQEAFSAKEQALEQKLAEAERKINEAPGREGSSERLSALPRAAGRDRPLPRPGGRDTPRAPEGEA